MRTIETQVYKFEELEPEVQEKVLDKNRCINLDSDWWDFVYDDFKEVCKIIGIEVENIYFSGFNSQGDGACFEGRYEYAKGSVKAIKKYAPKDTELQRIARELYEIQRRYFYSVWSTVKHRGHYTNENSTEIFVDNDMYLYDYNRPAPDDEITELLRDLMRWLYSRLEAEYEHLTSDETLIKTFEANGYEFDPETYSIV